MRGQPSTVDAQTHELASRYLGELRRQLCSLVGITEAGALPSDSNLLQLVGQCVVPIVM